VVAGSNPVTPTILKEEVIMKLFERKKKPQANTVLGKNTVFKGSLQTDLPIILNGHLEGEIHSQADVFVGEHGKIKANISGTKVMVSGEVIGNIEALQGLEIGGTGRVYGDISGAKLVIEKGAVYRGKVNMDTIAGDNVYEGSFELNP
jgi:cytoskeletal protein CcmA (bactofilin family)